MSHDTGRSRSTTIEAANLQPTSVQPEKDAEENEFSIDDFGVDRRRHRLDDIKAHRRLTDRVAASTFYADDDDQMTADRWPKAFQLQDYPAGGSNSDWRQATAGGAIISGNRFFDVRTKTQLQPPVETVVSSYQYPVTN
jgi:hypothetical protein